MGLNKLLASPRLILEEVGYQAGQHELLSDCYGKECSKMIDSHIKNVKSQTKKIKKEAEEIEERMKLSYKQLDKRKINYAEAHAELEAIKNSSEHDEKTLSRLELDKKISATNKRTRLLDDAKAQYAHQLIQTNKAQAEYYARQLPGVLRRLEHVYTETVAVFRAVFRRGVQRELGLAPIIGKCHAEMEAVLDTRVDPATDAGIVINK